MQNEKPLQLKLDELGEWFTTWRIPVNLKKCGVIECFGSLGHSTNCKYTLFGENLKSVQAERDLGVLINSNFSYKQHI